ncbi:E3 ubiquitin-protein ligase sina [Thelohanellus kitauei]|uniref:RING-type E3 ubiquitin transferase n=1 Tax=Thelohanellus kitauei TaxID=669202 RepID=A0A0C2N5U9_THEKT|nr:E3 ubiquitin-protein ligase sina [Thelohanellus kitauei]
MKSIDLQNMSSSILADSLDSLGYESSSPGPNPNLASFDIKTLFECPVCYNVITPPIRQCINGHPVCAKCICRLSACPTCRSTYEIQGRNLMMEKLSSIIDFPCRFSKFGCSRLAKGDSIERHEIKCRYQPYKCPYPGQVCSWEGMINEVLIFIIRFWITLKHLTPILQSNPVARLYLL